MPSSRRPLALVALLVGVVIGCWALITPEGGGPDEPGHLVRAGGVARGQFGDDARFEVTDHYLLPEVTCWIFQPTVAASCAEPRVTSGATISVPSRAYDYPVWSHGVAGLASRLPGDEPLWWARAANGVVAALLVGAAIHAVQRRPLAVAGVLAAVTPMAWFSMGIVNPSSMAIAGAIALWVGLVHRPELGWLVATGWAGLALPRRDGLIWAALSLVIALAVTDRRALDWWRELGLGPRALVGSSTLATVVWGFTSTSSSSRLVVLAPLLVVVAELVRQSWERHRAPGVRSAIAGGLGLAALLAAIVAVRRRPGGWDGELAGRVVGETGANLVEAIGRLGWLDAPLPWLAVAGWLGALGILASAALTDRADWLAGAIAVLAVSIVAAWVFELQQGGDTGTYWQGRYSLPMLVGIPILLGAARLRADVERSVASMVIVGVLVLDNVAIVAAARRFGVGTDGSLMPWNWDTYGAPVAPIVALAAHLAATGLLGRLLIEPHRTAPSRPRPDQALLTA